MMVGVFEIITGVLLWAGNKALPALHKDRNDRFQTQIELAKDLCQNHGDCEPQKAIVLKGFKVSDKIINKESGTLP